MLNWFEHGKSFITVDHVFDLAGILAGVDLHSRLSRMKPFLIMRNTKETALSNEDYL